MTSNVMLANASVVLAALAPSAVAVGPAHPVHAARTPRRPERVTHRGPLAVRPKSTRVRAERTDGRVTLTLV
jgi:hypothetical protein